MMTATETRTPRHTELHEGISGSGNTVWMVVTVRDSDGSWFHVEKFTSKAEADNWMIWG